MKPAHYDIYVVPGQRYDDEFIYPADLTNYFIEFWMSDRPALSTTAGTLPVTINHPSVGETTITPVFTTEQTKLMTKTIQYELRMTDTASVKNLLCYGDILPMVE